MSNVMGIRLVGAVVLGLSFLGAQAAEVEAAAAVATQQQAAAPALEAVPAPAAAASEGASLMGAEPIDVQVLAQKRGGTEVFNDMQLQGTVSENAAVNVATGSNLITEGSFAGAAGLPMVVQNTGNNVLIQNATILNIQVK